MNTKLEAQQDELFPFTWEGWDPVEMLEILLYGVQFTADFGIFKSGERLSSLTVDYDGGRITEFDDDGNILRQQRFKVVADAASESLIEARSE